MSRRIPKVKTGDLVKLGQLNPNGTRGRVSWNVEVGPSGRIPGEHEIGRTAYVISINGKAVR